jgi:tripartite-type tricarboxylate transporter receptor subunit TctC
MPAGRAATRPFTEARANDNEMKEETMPCFAALRADRRAVACSSRTAPVRTPRRALAAFLVAATCAAGAVLPGPAAAQAWPAKPIRIVLPWTAGGATDVIARALAQELAASLGQPVVVENRPGAGGTLGVGQVARAAPDGYTLTVTDVQSHAISPALYAKLDFDPLADLAPVALLAGSPMVLAVNPSLEVKTLDDLVALAKAKPRTLNYASSGNGAITHLAAEQLKRLAAIDVTHVPYKGSVPAVASVLAGDTAMAFSTVPAVLPHARAGKVVLVGTSFTKRSSLLPDVPAIAERFPGFDMGIYTGLFVPARTPREIVERLHAASMKALETPKLREVLAATMAEPSTMTPAQFGELVSREAKVWGDVVKAIGVRLD